MKKFFEEPKLYVEQFAVTDILTASSGNWFDGYDGVGGNPDETTPIVPKF